MTLTYTHQGSAIWTAEWDSVFVALLRENASVEMLGVMRRKEQAMLRRRRGEPISVFTIVPSIELKPIAEDVRKMSTEMMAEFGPQLRGTATVIGGSGFFPSLVRSLLAGIAVFSRVKTPQKSFGDVGRAVDWVAALDDQTEGVRGSSDEFAAALEEMLREADVSLL